MCLVPQTVEPLLPPHLCPELFTPPAGSPSELQQQAEQHLLTFSRQVIFHAADGAWQTQDKTQASTAAPEGFTWEQVRSKAGCSLIVPPLSALALKAESQMRASLVLPESDSAVTI